MSTKGASPSSSSSRTTVKQVETKRLDGVRDQMGSLPDPYGAVLPKREPSTIQEEPAKWNGFKIKKRPPPGIDSHVKAPPIKRVKSEIDDVSTELEQINNEIASVEKDITTNAGEFQKIRAAMLTGIVSYEGHIAGDKLNQLTDKLNALKTKREEAMVRMDKYINDHMVKSTIEIKKEPQDEDIGEGNTLVCKGGCKDLIFDRAGGVDICRTCGTTYDHSFDYTADYVPYEDLHMGEMPKRRGGGYKPPNHFAEILAQFQGRRRSCAPKHVVDMISDYCKRYHILPHSITPQVVRPILKQKQQEETAVFRWAKKKSKPDRAPHKYTDFYKHCTEIAWRLSGIPPPYMTPSQQDRIVAHFPLAIAAYRTSPRYLTRKANRVNRKKENPNNPNYYWLLYKLCQLLNYTEFLPYIPLPKSLANIEDCDENAWKHICQVNNWYYIPTK